MKAKPYPTVKVPHTVKYGEQTARAKFNFNVGDELVPKEVLISLIEIKRAAAQANASFNLLSKAKASAIGSAAKQLIQNFTYSDFPLKIWQSGSGTQSNMNVNEVIAKVASGKKLTLHPNDDVNMGQSSNDTFPTAMQMAAENGLRFRLLPALKALNSTLKAKSKDYNKVVKTGRTHMMDAVPISLGQEFSAYLAQIEECEKTLVAFKQLLELPLGGTAVGTGLNTHPKFAQTAVKIINSNTGGKFKVAANKFSYISAHDSFAQLSGNLKTLAIALHKMATDIRFMASGPMCGIGELILPANEPGSSIMPGKVNPTQCESLIMVCFQVIGLDTSITLACATGNLELNVGKPLIIYNIMKQLNLLSDAIKNFNELCLAGLQPNHANIERNLERSLMLVTALAPHLGYDNCTRIAQRALTNQISLKQSAIELGLITAKEFDRLLTPHKMV